jgi:hypothetical protein
MRIGISRDQEVQMRLLQKVWMVGMLVLLFSSAAAAGDFDWFRDFNIRAEIDPSGFKARLETRFRVGAMEINTVLSNVDKPADAYMVLRLGEMARQPVGYVMEQYRAEKGKGWGALARSLGIKPGSREFHALKRGQDLYSDGRGAKKTGKGKGKGKGRK